MEHWMNIDPWKDQIDLINDFDFIRKIEGFVIYEQACILMIIIHVPYIQTVYSKETSRKEKGAIDNCIINTIFR